MWSAISIIFGTTKPANTSYLFGPWFRSFTHKQRNLVLVGVAMFCWALWLSRNDVVFHESKSKSILQVMFKKTFWVWSWSILSREDDGRILKMGCCWGIQENLSPSKRRDL
jgi:hypothetical protein